MNTKVLTSTTALTLGIALIASSFFFALPHRAHALVVHDPVNYVENAITAIQSTLSATLDVTNTAANVAEHFNAYVLQPLAFVLSGDILKLITAGTIAFVIGKANGTGIPQFVTDVQLSLQTVSDAHALAYFDQLSRNSNSPFAASISSSLRNDYLSKTSLAGFWAANMNTLAQSTPRYAPGYLRGNWSQGGIHAWFALTTQTQNNPYTFYDKSRRQLGNLIGPGVGGATGARLSELEWGRGFMSWCGATTDVPHPSDQDGVNPGDPCTNKDGTKGKIKTPGTVIVDALNRALATDQEVLVRMGNVGPQVNEILGNIATVMQTVDFATKILGGPSSGGLFGVDQPSSSNSNSRLTDYRNTEGPLGVTQASIYQGASNLPLSGSDTLQRINQYESAWNTIGASANRAASSTASLADFCKSTNPEQSAAANIAFANDISPILVQATAAAQTVANARLLVQEVQTNLAGGEASEDGYTFDLQVLQKMSPTIADLAEAKQQAQTFGIATSTPEGSLTVSGGSIVDRMNLLSTNADAIKASSCTVSPSS